MTPSVKCLALINTFEGLELHPYLCSAGVATIGIGMTHYPDGKAVTMQDPLITELQANIMLAAVLISYANAVNRYVKVVLTQNQFDALVDFAYNLGNSALLGSTLLKKLNVNDYNGAAEQFLFWTHAGGVISAGLERRRMAERTLFLT